MRLSCFKNIFALRSSCNSVSGLSDVGDLDLDVVIKGDFDF